MNNKAVMLGLSVLAFLVAAVLVIMIFRMLFGGRLRMPGGRARQARLGIVDAFDLDRQRQLIIVRRDNVEHLIMIGGPNDIVIESEIVRAEARELREARREPGLSPAASDGRIPAPPPASGPQSLPRPAEEPMLPMPMPPQPPQFEPQGAAAEPPPRGPTFPLPPRRPAPPPAAPAPERRPAPPPKLPDSVSRGEDVPAFSGQPPAPAPAPPVPMPPVQAPPVEAPPVQQAAPAQAAPAPAPAQRPPMQPPSTAGARPPFLKPLPPRPPLRPMPRTSPIPPKMPGAPDSQGAPPQSPPPSAGRPPASPPPQAAPAKPGNDPLESLEEEMAKLLGR